MNGAVNIKPGMDFQQSDAFSRSEIAVHPFHSYAVFQNQILFCANCFFRCKATVLASFRSILVIGDEIYKKKKADFCLKRKLLDIITCL